MKFSQFCPLLHLLLTLTLGSCRLAYDAKNCGLPGKDFTKSRTRRLSSNHKSGLDYSEDYVLNEHDAEQDAQDPMRRKVMGGKEALMGESPWSVLLKVTGSGGTGRNAYSVDITFPPMCGGTLVTPRHFITAAHCFWKNDEKEAPCSMKDMHSIDFVRKNSIAIVGGICFEQNNKVKCNHKKLGTKMRVKNGFYEGFFKEGCTGTRDIAIMELDRDVPAGIHHICLPHLHNVDELDDFESLQLYSFGWGLDPLRGYFTKPTPILQKVDLGMPDLDFERSKMAQKECQKRSPTKGPGIFCTVEKSEKNVCQGDSGGGVIVPFNGRQFLVGIVSRGTGCEELLMGISPGAQAHTNISFYTADIDNVLNMKTEDRKAKWEIKISKHGSKEIPKEEFDKDDDDIYSKLIDEENPMEDSDDDDDVSGMEM